MYSTLIMVVAAICVACTSLACAAEKDAEAAKIMYSAWLCSIYAELKHDTAAQDRLFKLGYQNGRQFMDAALAGTITKEERKAVVPYVVVLLMAGPTPEFVLGRIFESAARDAYDDVVAEDPNGIPLDPADYVTSDELKASIATTKYMKANCEILR
ncbi:hypothetical protein AAFN47_12555 [Hoeflea sp. CAU 1731]